MGRTNRTKTDRSQLTALADRIKSVRVKKGLTQEQAAKAAKRRQSTWAGWEVRGGDLSYLTLGTIARALGVTVRDLV